MYVPPGFMPGGTYIVFSFLVTIVFGYISVTHIVSSYQYRSYRHLASILFVLVVLEKSHAKGKSE